MSIDKVICELMGVIEDIILEGTLEKLKRQIEKEELTEEDRDRLSKILRFSDE